MTATPELLRQVIGAVDEKLTVVNYRWNPNTLAYEVETVGGGTGADVNVTNVPLPVTDNLGSLTTDTPQLPAALTALGNLKVAVVESSGGGLTNTELRAAAVAVDGSGVTQPVSGPLTDTQLRAAAVPVSGPLTDTQLRAAAVPVSGPLTDAQLRAAVVPVSDGAGSLTVDGSVSVSNFPATQQVDVTDEDTRLLGRAKVLDSAGAVIDPTTKGQLPGALAASGALKVDQQSALPAGTNTIGKVDQGAAGAAAWPVSDGAGSLTVDSGQLPAALVGGRLDENVGAWLGSAAPTVGQKAMASSLPVAIASDQGALTTVGSPKATYRAVYRLAARPYALSKAMTANTRTQIATIHHTVAASTKTVKLRRVLVALESNSVAAIDMFDLVRITTAPATGNPQITPSPVNPGDAAAEAVCLALPTTAGTEGALHSTLEYNQGVTGAAPTANPPLPLQFFELYSEDEQNPMGEQKSLTLRAGTLEGFAVVLDSNALTTVKCYVIIVFTEE